MKKLRREDLVIARTEGLVLISAIQRWEKYEARKSKAK